MTEAFEFELVFALPKNAEDPFALSEAVLEASKEADFEDAIVGTGTKGLLAAALTVEGADSETVILKAARALVAKLPEGTKLHEIRPDIVSLADVAEKLGVTRQALQQREMPPPVSGGLYRIDEVHAMIEKAVQPDAGKRPSRIDPTIARGWFLAGRAAKRLNAMMSLRRLDPETIAFV